MSKAAASLMARSDAVAGTYVQRRYAVLFYLLSPLSFAGPGGPAPQAIVIECCWRRPLVAVLPMRTGTRDGSLFTCGDGLGRRFLAASWRNFSTVERDFYMVGLVAAANALRLPRATSIESEHIYAALSAPCWLALFGSFTGSWSSWPGSLHGGAIDASQRRTAFTSAT
jgi:hypothetical protein